MFLATILSLSLLFNVHMTKATAHHTQCIHMQLTLICHGLPTPPYEYNVFVYRTNSVHTLSYSYFGGELFVCEQADEYMKLVCVSVSVGICDEAVQRVYV